MKKGFTLVEMVAVVIILALICIIAIPSILNAVRETKNKLSDATKELIISAGRLHFEDSPNLYIKKDGNVYCATLQTLIDEDLLKEPLIDSVSKEQIDKNLFIEASVVGNTFDYNIKKTCEEIYAE